MFLRAGLFAGWAVLGMFASYGALYALTPYGVAILALCWLVGMGLRWAGRGSDLELIGLGAGPGLFCLLVASSAEGAAAVWTVVGAAIILAATVAYLALGRTRSAPGT